MKGIRDRLLNFLQAHRVLTVAVVATDGQPYAASLFYVVDKDLRFYVLSDPATWHGQALLARADVAGTVQRDQQQWHETQGVQFCGCCRPLDGPARARAWQLYLARFPFLMLENQVLTAALARTALWRIEPEWMRLIDNRLGFGHKEEWHRHRRGEVAQPVFRKFP